MLVKTIYLQTYNNSREFNHKVKGIGASSFTATEVTQLRNPGISGNEAVNAKYLANYDARSDRMKAPQNNTDLQHLRSWIRMKYIDKVWCDKTSSGSSSGGTASSKSSKSSNKSNGKSKKSESGRRKIMPEVNKPAPAEPAPDLFGGFDSIVPTSAPTSTANNDDDWDAFGGSSQNNAAADPFQADFSNMNSPAPAPTPSNSGQVMVHYHPQLGDQGVEATVLAPPSNPAPPANAFGNFSDQQQQVQPTMVSLPPAGNQMNNLQPQQQMQQPAFQANCFDQTPTMPQQQMGVPQQQQGGGFANFPSSSGQAMHPQPQEQSSDQGFANFSQQSQMQPQMQQAIGGQQINMQMQGGVGMMTNQQQQAQGMMNNNQPPSQKQGMGMLSNNQQQQMNFGQFPQQTQMQQPQQNNVQSSDGFANFSSIQAPQQVQHQIKQQSPNQPPPQQNTQSSDGFANFSSIQTPQQPEQMAMGQLPPKPPQQANIAQPTQETAAMNSQSSVVSAVGSEIPKPDQPSFDQNNNELAQPEVNPNAFQNVDNDKKSLFDDAFGGLSLERSPRPSSNNTATVEGNISSIQQPPLSPKKATPTFLSDAVGEITAYKEGQQVVYTNSEGKCPAVIAKVHYDDQLHPYYTINVQGREKQTDNAHLSLPGESSQNISTEPSLNTNSENDDMLLEETAAMLQKLNSQQLMQVQQLVASLVSSSNDQNTASHNMPALNGQMNGQINDQMNGITGHHQNQMSFGSIDTSSNLSMGNSSIPSVATGGVAQQQPSPMPPQMQYNPQQQQMGSMGSMPPQQMSIGAPTPPSSMPPPPPQPPLEPIQLGMGMGTPQMQPTMSQDQVPQISMQQQPMGAPPTAPTSNGMGEMNKSVPTPPQQPQEVEPMPEPEGNPFDLY